MAKYVIRFLEGEEKEVEADFVRKYNGGWEFCRRVEPMEAILGDSLSEEVVYAVTAKAILDFEERQDS